MRKNIISILIMVVLIFITFQILISSTDILKTVAFSFNIWKTSIFPSLFPFFVISEILINYGFIEFIGELFKPIMYKLFKTKGESAYVFIMGMISGFPSSAKYVRELHIKGILTENEATKIMTFTHFSNPLFILGTISIVFLNNKETGLIILLSHYISNIFIGIIFRNLYPSKEENLKFSLKKAIHLMTKKRTNNKKSFGAIISDALSNTINTLLLILGTITLFLIITTIIDNNISLNPYYQAILNGIIEMTQGLKYISILELPLKIKAIIGTMFISFGGISVHMQIISILSDTKIKYFPFLIARILHALISGLLIYFSFDSWISLF